MLTIGQCYDDQRLHQDDQASARLDGAHLAAHARGSCRDRARAHGGRAAGGGHRRADDGGRGDSIGASTIQSIGYGFGHEVSYYEKFYDWSIALGQSSKAYGMTDANTYKSGKRVYAVGTSAQLFANWFEA